MGDRDIVLAALRRRLQHAMDVKDAAELLMDEALQEAADLARAVDPGEDLEASHVLGLFHWYRYQALPEGDDRADFDAAVRLLYPVYRTQPQAVPEQLRKLYAKIATGADSRGAVRSGRPGLLSEVIELFLSFWSR